MSSAIRPAIVRTLDLAGRPIVKIALDPRGSRWAVLDAADFDALPGTLRERAWLLNDNGGGRSYVKVHSPQASGTLVIIARIIMDAGHRQEVTYKDGDGTNLRRSNLEIRKGKRAKRDHGAEVLRAAA